MLRAVRSLGRHDQGRISILPAQGGTADSEAAAPPQGGSIAVQRETPPPQPSSHVGAHVGAHVGVVRGMWCGGFLPHANAHKHLLLWVYVLQHPWLYALSAPQPPATLASALQRQLSVRWQWRQAPAACS